MDNTRFDILASGEWFTCTKVRDEGDGFFLYVLPHRRNSRGFFMLKNEEGQWHIPNRMMVEKAILDIEHVIAEQLTTDIASGK